jgi:hypothetical protein
MFKRLLPACLLMSALLLAATSLPAMEVSDGSAGLEIRQSAKQPLYVSRPPAALPVSTPAVPGDDDMPNRDGGGGGGRLPIAASLHSAPSQDRSVWGRDRVEPALYWDLIRLLIAMR